MLVKVGTFNLNNLFGRFNFRATIQAVQESGTYSFDPEAGYWLREFRGNLVKEKAPKDRDKITQRILSAAPDVLAFQEVEDKDTVDRFNSENLQGLYPHRVVIDANDPRLIDVGVMSNLPLGAITSWQHWVHPDDPDHKVFSRDLLQVEILDPSRSGVLLTLFVTHSKSQYVDWRLSAPQKAAQRIQDNQLRQRQSESIVAIISRATGNGGSYLLAGDLNDVPDSEPLAPLLAADNSLGLVNLADQLPPEERWTVRHKETGQPPVYQLFDYLLASPSLAPLTSRVTVGRRAKVGGDGSDHDPLFAVLDV